MKNKKQKYRLIEQTNNAVGGNNKTYVIEKNVRFLFWTWWSQNYLPDVISCYESYNKNDMLNMLDILNKKKKWIERRIVS